MDRYRMVRDVLRDRDVQQRIAGLYVDWGDALRSEGDYLAALETYGRIYFDVTHPRLWATADARRVEALCQWQAALAASGRPEEAGQICEQLRRQYPEATCDGCDS